MKEQDIRRIAAEALCDPRTVKRLLSGGVVRKMMRERIEAAAKGLGIPLAPKRRLAG